jgi:mycobactin lysine-N-oxygenase
MFICMFDQGDILGGLNEQQQRAVTHQGGPLLVLAGAGTGKTRTLVARAAWLRDCRGVPASRILLLTFTRRAAADMLARAAWAGTRRDGSPDRICGGTFHAIAHKIIRRHAESFCLPPQFTILDPSDTVDILDVLRPACPTRAPAGTERPHGGLPDARAPASTERTEGEVILAVMPTLIVVGAGPKGIALAAKARAVAAAGLTAPRVVLVDPGPVAGNWSGKQGYTSGLLPLGTPAEKDVGFPYADSWGAASSAVTAAMAEYSWQRHLVANGAYADWVDRGRLRPTHRRWSCYLREVAEKADAEIVAARVVGLEVDGERWRVDLDPGEAIWADGVVVTGAGPPIGIAGQPRQHPRVLDGRSYWLHERAVSTHVAQDVCVIGSGETAASVVISLVAALPKHSTIDVLTSRGVLYSRGESYEENRLYSDPGDWPGLAESHRREFLERTDRGVFSQQAEAVLNASRGFRALAGRAVHIQAGERQVVVTIEYGHERERVAYDLVVVAIGFRARWFEGLLGDQARRRLEAALAGEELERRIDLDLSAAGLSPPLHLPGVAGLAQGPGFPNLSCLGLLSDRILRRYVTPEVSAREPEERSERV